jgi:hypothetical protein
MARTIATCGPMTTRWVLPPILTPVNVRDVGGETIKNARLRIGEVFPGTKYRPRNSVDTKLGSDFLQANRLIIVPGKDAILFTYNGGAVFQRERPDAETGLSEKVQDECLETPQPMAQKTSNPRNVGKSLKKTGRRRRK